MKTPIFEGKHFVCVVIRNHHSGRRNRFNVFRFEKDGHGPAVIGRELPIGHANKIAKKAIAKQEGEK